MKIKLSELKRLIREELLKESIEGKSFCVTGTLSRPRSQIWQMIEDAGGIIHKGIKRDTDYLILGSDVGYGKTSKAQSLGIKTMTERELYNMMKGRGRPSTRELTAHRGSGRYLGTERIGKLRGRGYNYGEKEPSYLDLAGLTSESRELIKEIYNNEVVEREIKNSEYGKYLKSVTLVSSDLQNDPDNDLYRATLVVPLEDLDGMYGSSKQAENVSLFDRNFRTEFEVYNSDPGSFNRTVSLENKRMIGNRWVFDYIFRDFYNV